MGFFSPTPRAQIRTFENSASDEAKRLRKRLNAAAVEAALLMEMAVIDGQAEDALKWADAADRCRSLAFSLPLDAFEPGIK